VIQIIIAVSSHALLFVILMHFILVLLVKNVHHDVKKEMEKKFMHVFQSSGFHLLNFLNARTFKHAFKGRAKTTRKLILTNY
jgi:hypothetical protein